MERKSENSQKQKCNFVTYRVLWLYTLATPGTLFGFGGGVIVKKAIISVCKEEVCIKTA